jgi:serine/threonine-protein kinase
VATRVKEALGFEKSFDEASTLLLAHLRDKPECRDLIEELTTGERERNAARQKATALKPPAGSDTTLGNNPV